MEQIGFEIQKMVELKDVDIYQGKDMVMSAVNLSLRSGEFCYLTGKTGSGKSSLLSTIYGDLRLKKGDAVVAGFDLKTLSFRNKHLFRRSLGMIFQDYFLFQSWTVFENLDYILRALSWQSKSSRERRIKEVLIDVAMIKTIYRKVHELSGGEQQRIAIARAIINRPNLLIADEPTGNLDEQSADDLMYMIKKISATHSTAVLFATHDQRIVQKFPASIYKCESGKLLDLG